MADILEYMNSRPQWLDERLELSREGLARFAAQGDEGLTAGVFLKETAHFLQDALRIFDLKEALLLEDLSLEKQKGVWEQLMSAPVWKWLSDGLTCADDRGLDQLLRAALTEWRLAGGYGLWGQKLQMVICLELFLQIVQLFEMERSGEESGEELKESVRQALYYHFSDYCDVTAALFWRNILVAGPYTAAVETAGPEDLYGIYRLAWPPGKEAAEDSLREAGRLGRLAEEDLVKEAKMRMAEARIRLPQPAVMPSAAGKRSTGQAAEILTAVEVEPGRERLAKCICALLRQEGYTPVCFRPAGTLMNRAAAGLKPGELSLFLDRALKERRVAEEKNALEVYREQAARLARVIYTGQIASQETESPARRGAAESAAEAASGSDRRREKIEQEFRQEIFAVRQKFFPGY